ncbi:Vitamin B12 transporter BtuB [Usitatibacter rugosus]|uniref:Vitamin B12 transporter BtuB n=1 Tax=Usitatibacter rugosus TaxID=2732067 RepID=A0A6M4GYF8_9PROT|nr:TonB-dependent receptor [Usitatibacter rugosus]QJR12055.1 Vitamin B12 transporter BtuB [Usitatibacter rugosus]
MKTMNRKRLTRALAHGFAVAMAASAAHAQQVAQTTEKIQVTGSNIKRVDSETPSPVVTITREQIQQSGQRDIAELLRNVPAVSAGSQLDMSANSFSGGAQTVSLRGLGSASTLVLLNGRRMTPSAYADPNTGNSTVYNLNAIPVDAIERIEILKDGASAIYGSDALAGVVNIILRSDYDGAEVSASIGQNEQSEFGTYRASVTAGYGTLAKQGFNILGSFEAYHRDPVTIKELTNVPAEDLASRGGWRTTQSTNGFPANYFRENVLGNGNFATFVGIDSHCPPEQVIAARCRYDSYKDVNIIFDQDRTDAYLRGSLALTANHTAFAEFLFSRVKTDYFSTPAAFNSGISVWGTAEGNLRQYRLILPVGHPDNPTTVPVAAAYTFSDVGRRTDSQTNDTSRFLVGVKGVFGAWDYETAFLYNKNEREDVNGGYLFFPGLQAAMNSASYRFDGRQNSPDVISQISTSFKEVGESSVTSWDLRGSRELMPMAGGPLSLAVGVEVRKEELQITSDPKIVAGDIVGRGTSSANGDRTVEALYAELSFPVLKNLEASAAIRTEHYSDFGNATTPKFGVKYTPWEFLALRGTYAKGFRAPALTQISESSVQAFNNGVRDPIRCPVFDANLRDCATSFASYIRANPDLKPEKSDNYNLGFIIQPTRDLSATVDYWRIKRKDQIDRFSAAYLLAREAQFPQAIVRDPNPATWLPGVPNSGPIFAVLRQFFNLATTEVDGVDVDFSWTARPGELGKVVTTLGGTYLAHYKYAVAPTDPILDQAGSLGGPSDALPRFKGNLSSTWTYGPWAFTGRVNYVRGWFDGQNGPADQGGGCFFTPGQLVDLDCRVKPWTTVDVGVVWTGIRGLTLGLLVRNLADKAAPFDPNFEVTTAQGFNAQFHNALGRYYTANVSYKFK